MPRSYARFALIGFLALLAGCASSSYESESAHGYRAEGTASFYGRRTPRQEDRQRRALRPARADRRPPHPAFRHPAESHQPRQRSQRGGAGQRPRAVEPLADHRPVARRRRTSRHVARRHRAGTPGSTRLGGHMSDNRKPGVQVRREVMGRRLRRPRAEQRHRLQPSRCRTSSTNTPGAAYGTATACRANDPQPDHPGRAHRAEMPAGAERPRARRAEQRLQRGRNPRGRCCIARSTPGFRRPIDAFRAAHGSDRGVAGGPEGLTGFRYSTPMQAEA